MPYLGKQADENGAVINSYEFLQGTDTSTFSVPSNAGDHIEVYLNGILIVEGGSNDYTRTTSTITFASSPSDGDLIKINVIGSITIFDTVPASGGTFSGEITAPSLKLSSNIINPPLPSSGKKSRLGGVQSQSFHQLTKSFS